MLERMPSDLTSMELQFRLVTRNKSNIVAKHKVWLPFIDSQRATSDSADQNQEHTIEKSMTSLEA